MLVSISELISGKIARQEIEKEFTINEFWDGSEFVKFNKPVKVKGTFRKDKDDNTIIFTGKLESELILTCSRCLETFNYNVALDLNERFARSIENEDEDIMMIRDSKVDFAPVIERCIMFDLPVKRLCSEECKGLCTQCGANLNVSECICDINEINEDKDSEEHFIDPRFAKLRGLFKDNK